MKDKELKELHCFGEEKLLRKTNPNKSTSNSKKLKDTKLCNWCGNKIKWWQRKVGDCYHKKCWFEAYEQNGFHKEVNLK